MHRTIVRSAFICIALAAGCADNATIPSGNADLAIATFTKTEHSGLIEIVANNASGEVARVQLYHGRFKGGAALDYREVEGRWLKVTGDGGEINWQTEGYTDTTHMPALPHELSFYTKLLADPHVKPVLDTWRIGFRQRPTPAGEQVVQGEQSYDYQCDNMGSRTHWCGSRCDSSNWSGESYQVCGGKAALSAVVMHEDGTFNADEDTVAECCPSDNGGGMYGVKTCRPDRGATSCGSSGQQCTPCPGYVGRWSGHCSQWWNTHYGFYDQSNYQIYDACRDFGACYYNGAACSSNDQCCSAYCDGSTCSDSPPSCLSDYDYGCNSTPCCNTYTFCSGNQCIPFY